VALGETAARPTLTRRPAIETAITPSEVHPDGLRLQPCSSARAGCKIVKLVSPRQSRRIRVGVCRACQIRLRVFGCSAVSNAVQDAVPLWPPLRAVIQLSKHSDNVWSHRPPALELMQNETDECDEARRHSVCRIPQPAFAQSCSARRTRDRQLLRQVTWNIGSNAAQPARVLSPLFLDATVTQKQFASVALHLVLRYLPRPRSARAPIDCCCSSCAAAALATTPQLLQSAPLPMSLDDGYSPVHSSCTDGCCRRSVPCTCRCTLSCSAAREIRRARGPPIARQRGLQNSHVQSCMRADERLIGAPSCALICCRRCRRSPKPHAYSACFPRHELAWQLLSSGVEIGQAFAHCDVALRVRNRSSEARIVGLK